MKLKKTILFIVFGTAVVLMGIKSNFFHLIKKKPLSLPHIILISKDTLRADHLGCYGYNRNTSPNIDLYSRDFVLFEKAISASPTTSPAHMSLFTGMTPPVHGVKNWSDFKDDNNRLIPEIKTLVEILKDNGYLTAGFHAGGNVDGRLGFARGFDLYTREKILWREVKSNPKALEPMREWIKRSKLEGKPLFLFFHHYICHDPYLRAPREYLENFLKNPVEGLPVWADDFIGDRDSFWKNVDLSDPLHLQHMISLYDGNVSYADYIFGRLMEVLKEEKIYQDSIIVLLSDHGEEFFEHGDKLHWRLFIESLHVPFMLKLPGSEFGGKRISTQVRAFDIMPTLLRLIQIKPDDVVEGTSLLPLIRGKGNYRSSMISFSPEGKYLRFNTGEYVYSNQPSYGIGEWLYSLKDDPLEKFNLAAKNIGILSRMRDMADKIFNMKIHLREKLAQGENEKVEADRALLEQLKALGYIK